ncbi:MAG TPA: sigma-70 family RNA polymerase sigma factor [Candidatus Acidoferrum sp.]|nr:sigma-70 family RNA polymerase sigma factor [Candidatus Acidoferrum sp.]
MGNGLPAMVGPGALKKEKEARLIEDVLAGRHEQFHELIAPYRRGVYLTAYDILQVAADAEEVAQEAFLKAFRALRSFRRESQFSTWLFRIAINEARMRLRRRREVPLETAFPGEDEDGDYTPLMLADWREIPSEALLREETRRLVQESIAQLPEKYREVLTLRDVVGKNIAETSEILGTTTGNTKARLLRARLMLRDIFAERTRRKPRQKQPGRVAP